MKKFLYSIVLLSVTTAASAKDSTVTQKGKAFSTSDVAIKVGESVIFKNDDDTSHNVFSSAEGMKFNLGIQKQGTETSHKFDKPGVFEVRCAIHPKMKLKVTVTP